MAERKKKPTARSSNLSRPNADTRLKELILHIARQSEGDETFGAVKLNKILFNADFTAYVKLGKSITGQKYFALEYGPAPRRLKPVLADMVRRREAAIREDDFHGYRQRRAFALREADLSLFDSEEIALVDHIIRDWRNLTGTELSQASHRFIGWKVAAEGESIPYSVALVCRREPTKKEQEVAKSLEQSLR
ncbi:MAG: Panacea domain-containing protein [bacterium]